MIGIDNKIFLQFRPRTGEMTDLIHCSHVEIIDNERSILPRPGDMLCRPSPADHGDPIVLSDLPQHLFPDREPVTVRFTEGDLLGYKPIPSQEQEDTQACHHPWSHTTVFY